PKSTMRAPAARCRRLRTVAFDIAVLPVETKTGRRGLLRVAPSVLLPERLRPPIDQAAVAPSVGRGARRDRSPDRLLRCVRSWCLSDFGVTPSAAPARCPARSPARRQQPITRSSRLLQRQDQLDHLLDIGVGNTRRVRRHRNRTPDSGAALLYLLDQHLDRLGIAAVLGRNILVRRPDDLLVFGVACVAALLLHHVLE